MSTEMEDKARNAMREGLEERGGGLAMKQPVQRVL